MKAMTQGQRELDAHGRLRVRREEARSKAGAVCPGLAGILEAFVVGEKHPNHLAAGAGEPGS